MKHMFLKKIKKEHINTCLIYYPNELETYHNWYLGKNKNPNIYQSNIYLHDKLDSNPNYRNYKKIINDVSHNNNNSGKNVEYRDKKNIIDQNLNDIISHVEKDLEVDSRQKTYHRLGNNSHKKISLNLGKNFLPQ